MGLITVIVPVYNVASYVGRCIESILNQTYLNLEVLLINDGSTDESGDICDYYGLIDSRVKVIHKKNEGLSVTRNLGIEIALGNYLLFIDSDDWISPNMIENLSTVIHDYEADIACINIVKVWEEKEIIKNREDSGTVYLYSGEEAVYKYLLTEDYQSSGIITPVCNKLYKKNLFDEIRFPVNKIFEDGYVTYKLLHQSRKVAEIHKVGYFYFQRTGSIMNSGLSEKKLLSYDAKREMYLYFKNKGDEIRNLVTPLYIDDYFCKYLNIVQCSNDVEESLKRRYINFLLHDLREDFIYLLSSKISFKQKTLLILFIISPKIYYQIINIINVKHLVFQK